MKKVSIVIMMLFMAGCTTMTPEKFALKTDDEVCRASGYLRNILGGKKLAEPWMRELEKRNLLTEREIAAVNNKEIFIGMTECALYASWGSPKRTNRSVSHDGINIQNIYGDYSKYSKPTYVYTRNGVVTSWQD
ncbi:MAG TPA: hypothetical protein DCG63_03855 [Methylophilaceae bacterium]|nr:hypothetical protein [Methylophilaceae bacterium]